MSSIAFLDKTRYVLPQHVQQSETSHATRSSPGGLQCDIICISHKLANCGGRCSNAAGWRALPVEIEGSPVCKFRFQQFLFAVNESRAENIAVYPDASAGD